MHGLCESLLQATSMQTGLVLDDACNMRRCVGGSIVCRQPRKPGCGGIRVDATSQSCTESTAWWVDQTVRTSPVQEQDVCINHASRAVRLTSPVACRLAACEPPSRFDEIVKSSSFRLGGFLGFIHMASAHSQLIGSHARYHCTYT
jgi:hypothetical protein